MSCGGLDLRSVHHGINVLEKPPGRALAYRLQPVCEDGIVPLLEEVSKDVVIFRQLAIQDAVAAANASLVPSGDQTGSPACQSPRVT